MLGLSSLGARKKPRQFEYKPRHFDPELQAREERRRVILGEEYNEGEYKPGVLIRDGRMRRTQMQADKAHKDSRSTLIRTAVFVGFVFMILWMITNYFGQSFN